MDKTRRSEVQEVSRFGKESNKIHIKAVKQLVDYLWQREDG